MNSETPRHAEPFGCHGCSITSCPSHVLEDGAKAPLSGLSLVATAAACFLVPIACALTATMWLEMTTRDRNLAVLLGLALGLLLTAGAARVARARSDRKETKHG